MSYSIILSNGTTLVDIPTAENDGTGNQSTPVQIKNVLIDPTTNVVSFVVSGNVASRFVAGFTFTVGGGTAYVGTYTVSAGGASYTTVNDEQATVIPVVEGIQNDAYVIEAVDTAANTLYVSAESACGFVPTTSVVLSGNSNSGSNGTYTVQSSEASDTYPISSVDDTANTFNLIGDHTKFFKAGMTFVVTGNTTTGNGTYTVVSSAYASGETTVSVADVPTSASATGVINLYPKLVAVTTTTAVPVGTTASGSLDVSPYTAAALTADTPIVSPLSTGVYSITFFVTGDKSSVFGQYITSGCEILIKDNNVLKHNRVTVISSTYNSGLNVTALEVRYTSSTTPAVTATGTAVIPALPLPYGTITYSVSTVSSPLMLVGKGAVNYNATTSWGLAFQTNAIRMLENFANGTAPVSPLVGQGWFDTTTPQFWLRDTSSSWKNFVVAGLPSSAAVHMGNQLITNVADATADQDALNRRTGDARYVNVTGDTMTGTLIIDGTADLLLNTSSNDLTMQGGTVTLNSTSNIVLAGTGGVSFTGSGDLTLTTANNDITLNGGDISLGSDSSILFTGTGTVNMNNNRITNVGLPTSSADAANKAYVDSLSSGIIWLQPIRDANLFDDSLGVPPAVPAAYVDYDHTYLVKPVQYAITAVTTGTNGKFTFAGNHAARFATGHTLKVINNANGASNTTYTVVSATNNGANTEVTVSSIVAGTTVSGTILHSAGDWNGKDGRIVYYDTALAVWVDVLERVVAVGDRFGVFLDPNNYDPLSSLPAGGLASQAGKIAIITAVAVDTYATTWSFYTPAEPDAVSVHGVNAVGFGSSYTFRGTWGTGTYGTDYTWIEFAGPTAVVDGAGLAYQGNILYVGQGTGITVNANDVALNTTYTDGLYIRRDGSTAATADISLGGNKLTNIAAPTIGTDAVNQTYVASNYQPLNTTLTSLTTAVTVDGSSFISSKVKSLIEKATIAAAAPTATQNVDIKNNTVIYHTVNATANFTLNFRGDGSTSLDSMLGVGESITVAFLVTNGATPYYPSAHQIDGSAVTPKWQGGTAPSAGDASAVDVYTYTIIKTASATFTTLAAQTKFA